MQVKPGLMELNNEMLFLSDSVPGKNPKNVSKQLYVLLHQICIFGVFVTGGGSVSIPKCLLKAAYPTVLWGF